MSNLSKTIAILGVVAGLGVAALPLSSYAANTETTRDVPVSLTIEPILQISTSADGEVDEGTGLPTTVNDVVLTKANTTDGAEYASAGFTVNVKTNNSLGYTISMMGTKGETALKSDAGDTINTGTLKTGSSAWAFKVNPGEGESTQSAWTNIPATSTQIYKGTQEKGGINSIDGVDTAITFGATVADTQAAGTYKGSVTFTAAAVVASESTD